jgi:hypothetical protein
MMNRLFLLHESSLSLHHPMFEDLNETDDLCLFVWDEERFKRKDYPLVRLVFIYERLCELPCQIIQGDFFNVIQNIVTGKNLKEIFISEAYSTKEKSFLSNLGKNILLIERSADPFLTTKNPKGNRRFFTYWKLAQKELFNETKSKDIFERKNL